MKINPDHSAKFLTKREYFIAAALQGLLASSPTVDLTKFTYAEALENFATCAIKVADQVIKQINAET
jgi:hypothetical protein